MQPGVFRRMSRHLFFLLFVLLSHKAEAGRFLAELSSDLEQISERTGWMNLQTLLTEQTEAANHFSRTDENYPYGFGFKGSLPMSCQSKNLKLQLSADVRVHQKGGKYALVFSILSRDSTVLWDSRPLQGRIHDEDRWTAVRDEWEIPRSMTGKDCILMLYLWNEDGKNVVDLDNFHLLFLEKELPSYIAPFPKAFQEHVVQHRLAGNSHVELVADTSAKVFAIRRTGGDELLNHFALEAEWKDGLKGGVDRKQFSSTAFRYLSDSLLPDGHAVCFECSTPFAQVRMVILVPSSGTDFTVRTESIFTKPVQLCRLSLMANFIPAIKEVCFSSGRSETSSFQEEYWLGQGGFLAGSGDSSIFIYACRELSSLQLNVPQKYIAFNLDYSADHPLLHWPLLKGDVRDVKEDYSSSLYNKGSVLKNSIQIGCGPGKPSFPRFMNAPSGYSASFLWTEHADYTDLRIQRAVFFGSDSIHRAAAANGGFVKNKIPVTKSIFYTNPDGLKNKEKAGFVKTDILALKTSPEFEGFLQELKGLGNEICLHTPDHFTTTRTLLEQALSDVKNKFGAVTWIDHGYDNPKKSNREDLFCDGLDSTSKYYAADLWKRYGVKYFWNGFFEDTSVYSAYAYGAYFTIPYSGWGEAFPAPVYWRHSSRSGDLVHWRTVNTIDPADAGLWDYYFSDSRLADLVHSRGTYIAHCYPARADSTTGFYDRTDSSFTINPSFEKVLEKQARLRDQGMLWMCTVRQWLDYQLALEKVSYDILGNGQVRISNRGNVELKGLSFSLKAKEVGVAGKEISKRTEGEDLIFWFDLGPGDFADIDWK